MADRGCVEVVPTLPDGIPGKEEANDEYLESREQWGAAISRQSPPRTGAANEAYH